MSIGRMTGRLEGDAESVARLRRLTRGRQRGRYFGTENAKVAGASEAPTAPKARISSSDVGPGVAPLAGSAASKKTRWGRAALPLLTWAFVAAAVVFWIGGRAQQPSRQSTTEFAGEGSGGAGGGGAHVAWRASGGASAIMRTEPGPATGQPFAETDSATSLISPWAHLDASSDIRRLVGQEWSAYAACQARGPAAVCQLDRKLTHELFARGWCWGFPGQPEYAKAWNPCPAGATSPGRVHGSDDVRRAAPRTGPR